MALCQESYLRTNIYQIFLENLAHRHPSYIPSFSTKISPSKETALTLTQGNHCTTQYKVYCERSSLKGGVGAAAVLYKNDGVIKVCRCHLGSGRHPGEHMVYKAELIGTILTLHLLLKLSCQITRKTIIGLVRQPSSDMST